VAGDPHIFINSARLLLVARLWIITENRTNKRTVFMLERRKPDKQTIAMATKTTDRQ
jgi:hypothetical protein